jgi:hypothetical protein
MLWPWLIHHPKHLQPTPNLVANWLDGPSKEFKKHTHVYNTLGVLQLNKKKVLVDATI